MSIGSVAGALWVALRSRLEPPGGIVVGTGLMSPLWTMVAELSEAVKTRRAFFCNCFPGTRKNFRVLTTQLYA